MTTETGGSAETTATEAPAEVDAQLAEMQSAEKEPVAKEPATTEETAPEVKKVVPLAALHEERRARQELQRELQTIRQDQARRDEIIERRLAALAPQQKGPTREEDPAAYLDARIGELTQAQRQMLQRDQQREQQQEQARQIDQVKNAVIQSAHEMKAKTPDFLDAVTHLNTMRTRELVTLGMPEEQAKMQAANELDQATMTWTVQGRNPAETAYEFAKARGYTPKQAAAAEKIAAQQKGLAAAKSLGGGGSVAAGKLTAEALANMSDDDFAKLTDSQFKQAMGG